MVSLFDDQVSWENSWPTSNADDKVSYEIKFHILLWSQTDYPKTINSKQDPITMLVFDNNHRFAKHHQTWLLKAKKNVTEILRLISSYWRTRVWPPKATRKSLSIEQNSIVMFVQSPGGAWTKQIRVYRANDRTPQGFEYINRHRGLSLITCRYRDQKAEHKTTTWVAELLSFQQTPIMTI